MQTNSELTLGISCFKGMLTAMSLKKNSQTHVALKYIFIGFIKLSCSEKGLMCAHSCVVPFASFAGRMWVQLGADPLQKQWLRCTSDQASCVSSNVPREMQEMMGSWIKLCHIVLLCSTLNIKSIDIVSHTKYIQLMWKTIRDQYLTLRFILRYIL